MPSQTVNVIYFEIAGKKKFISDKTVRPDKKLAVMYSDTIDEAQQFEK